VTFRTRPVGDRLDSRPGSRQLRPGGRAVPPNRPSDS